MMRTDIVGGVQALAEKWVEADEALSKATRSVKDATEAERQARDWQYQVAKELMTRVGANVTTKVFKIGTDVVIVEHEHGIRRIAIEDGDR